MVDRILLNKQEERFFFEYLRIAGGRTPEACAAEIAAPLERDQGEILRFYWQTVDTIFKGQKGALEGFTHQRTHRILTKFYDTKVVPLYGGAGGSREAGGSERKGAGRRRKGDVGGMLDGLQDAHDRNMVHPKEVVEEAELSSGSGGAVGDRGRDGVENVQDIPQAAPREVSVSQKHSAPGHYVSKGLGSTPCMHGGSVHTANTPSQGVGAGRSGPSNVVDIMFVPHSEELAIRLAAEGFDPCPRMRLETSETVVGVMERLERGWKAVLENLEGGLRLRAPDDCPAVFRGCVWGDPVQDGDLTLMDVMEALGTSSSTTMGYSWEACAGGPGRETRDGSDEVPSLTVTERLTAKKGKGLSKTKGGKKQKDRGVEMQGNALAASGREGAGGQGTEQENYDRQLSEKAGSSAEKENTANKSISFEQQAIASFGSPAEDSGPVKEGGLPEPREGGPSGVSTGYRVPVGIKNLVKQEQRLKKRQKGGRKPQKDPGVSAKGSAEEQIVRNALERLADSLRQQQEIELHGGPRGMFSFGAERKEVLKSLQRDSLLELLRLEASNPPGQLPLSQPAQNGQNVQNGNPAKTPPTKKRRKKGNLRKSNKNGVIDDPRDLAGLSPPSTFKLPEEFTRVATGGINGASVRSLTDIFATCHPPPPITGGGDTGGGGGEAGTVAARATPTGGALLNLSKSAGLPPGFNLKTCDMSSFSLMDGMSNSNWIMKLGDAGGNGELEPKEAVGNRPFAKLFGEQ